MPQEPQIVQSAKAIGRSVIDKLGPRDLVSVVFTRDNRHTQDFTQDKARLLAAVNTFASAGHDPRNVIQGVVHTVGPTGIGLAEMPYYWASLGALDRVVSYLGAVEDRRKTVLSVSVGIPLDPDEIRDASNPMSAIFDRMTDVLRTAAGAGVNVYSIDPGGLDGLVNYLKKDLFIRQSDTPASRGPKSVDPTQKTTKAEERASFYRDYLKAVSDNTGGHAFVNANEFNSRVAQIFRETGAFYLLGYRSTNGKQDGNLRRLQVRVNRPGLTVNVRTGQYARLAAGVARPAAPVSPAMEAIAGLLPKRDLPLQVVAAPFSVPGRKEALVAIVLGLDAPTATSVAGSDSLSLLVSAYSPEGDPRATDRLRADVAFPATGTGHAGYEVPTALNLEPGRYELRLSADSALQKKSGSVYYDVEVPDFASAPLSLSGLVLGVVPGPPAAPTDRFAAMMPIVPTAQRTFATTDRVTAFVRLYQGGGAPLASTTTTVRILDDRGATVVSLPRTFSVEDFGSARSADDRFEVPLAQLTPGPHLLTVEATLGKTTVRRDVRFDVR